MNYSFAVLALEAGLDSGIADPLDGGLQAVICGTETLLGMREEEFCMGYIQHTEKGALARPENLQIQAQILLEFFHFCERVHIQNHNGKSG